MKEIGSTIYSKEAYKDENMLLNLKGLTPTLLSRNLTWLWGNELKMPLLTLTEASGAVTTRKPIKAGNPQYYWNVMTKLKMTTQVVKLCTVTSQPARGGQPIVVEFNDNHVLIPQYSLRSPDGKWQLRIERVETTSEGTYRATLRPFVSKDEYIDMANFRLGLHWAQAVPTIPQSKSDGNYSNTQSPMQVTNQFGYHRFSEVIAGNASNFVVNFTMEKAGGETEEAWMPLQMKEWEFKRRLVLGEDLWFSEYNRNARNVIEMIDPDTGEPVPRGAGIKEILTAAGRNYEFTESSFNIDLLDYALESSFNGRLSNMPAQVYIHCGKGFIKLFNKMLMKEARNNGYFDKLGMEEIQKVRDGELRYGSYFTSYRTINGQIVHLVEEDAFTYCPTAEAQKANNFLIDGLPPLSYTGVVMNHGKENNGERNVMMVYEEGRDVITGVYEGMSNIPAVWGAAPTVQMKKLGTRKDIASYEYMCSQGINIANPYSCFYMNLAYDLI